MTTPESLVPIVHVVAAMMDGLGLAWALGGAVANNYWGAVRTTQDLDFLVMVPALRFQELATALTGAGFKQSLADGSSGPVEVPPMLREIQERRLFTVLKDGIKVEFFVPFLPLQHEILRRAKSLPFEGRSIPVTTAEDLIVLKMIFHRGKDIRDVKGMLAAQKGRLDIEYLRSAARSVIEDKVLAELEDLIRKYAGLS